MTHNYLIQKHLYTHGSITAMEALRLYGCYRLASRIKNIRDLGVEIKTILITKNNKRFGKYILLRRGKRIKTFDK